MGEKQSPEWLRGWQKQSREEGAGGRRKGRTPPMLLGKCASGSPYAHLSKNQGRAGAAEVSGDPDLGGPWWV